MLDPEVEKFYTSRDVLFEEDRALKWEESSKFDATCTFELIDDHPNDDEHDDEQETSSHIPRN